LRNAVAVAEEGRDGDVRYLGEIDTTEAATRKLVTKLAAKYRQLKFCLESLAGNPFQRRAADFGGAKIATRMRDNKILSHRMRRRKL
jgi:transposase